MQLVTERVKGQQIRVGNGLNVAGCIECVEGIINAATAVAGASAGPVASITTVRWIIESSKVGRAIIN